MGTYSSHTERRESMKNMICKILGHKYSKKKIENTIGIFMLCSRCGHKSVKLKKILFW